MNRRRRLIGLVLVVGTAVLALSTLRGNEHDVSLRYEAPPGPLTVTLSNAEGARIRRTTFAAGASRQHEIRLSNGQFRARMELPDRPVHEHVFQIEGEQAVLITWPP